MNGKKRPAYLFAVLGVAAVTATLAYEFSNARKGYEPRQPILFRHTRMAGAPVWQVGAKGEKVNAGVSGSPASTATRCPTRAGTPPSLHRGVHELPHQRRPEQGVGPEDEGLLGSRRADPLGEGHDLPDFVYYDHAAHVNAVDDQGHSRLPLVTSRARPWSCARTATEGRRDGDRLGADRFNMQWCLDCHRKPEMKASTDCVTCHR